MSSSIVRKYLTQDFDEKDTFSYEDYLSGNQESTRWMKKALSRREPLLLLELKCNYKLFNGYSCDGWININETGICKCIFSHYCYDQVIEAIEAITNKCYKDKLVCN